MTERATALAALAAGSARCRPCATPLLMRGGGRSGTVARRQPMCSRKQSPRPAGWFLLLKEGERWRIGDLICHVGGAPVAIGARRTRLVVLPTWSTWAYVRFSSGTSIGLLPRLINDA